MISATDTADSATVTGATTMTSRGINTFPTQLHYVLHEMERDGLSHIASWQPHGRCFKVHNRNEFVKKILPCWFRQTQYTSFQRQLNIYGFKRIASAPDKDSYYHEKFVQNQPLLAHEIKRTAVKGQGPRRCQALCDEPNFYLQPSASDGTKSTSATSSTASTLVPTKGLLAPPSLSILPGANRPENPGHGLDATTHLATFDSVGTFRLGGNLETQLWRHVQEQRARNDQLALLLALQSNTSNNNSESLPYQPPFSFQLLSPPPSNSTSMLQAHVNAIENVRARARLGNL